MSLKEKKVCIMVQSHYSHTMGGAEYRCKLVLDYLIKLDLFDISYVCINIDPKFVPRGYQVYKVGTRLNKYGLFFDLFQLQDVLKKIKPDIIYQNGGSSYTGIAALYAKKNGANLVHQICNDNNLKLFSGLRLRTRIKKSVDDLFFKYGIRHANIIIGQSASQSELLSSRFGRRCDIVIPLGHPLPEHKVEKAEDIKVLWISNFKYHQKQPHLFVELAKRFQSYNNLSFVMIGGSIGRENEFKKLLSHIDDVANLTYLGQVSQEEANRQLREGHIFVNTSRYEGFPNTFVQAWMREVPVVSLNVNPNDVLIKRRVGFHSVSFEKLVSNVKALVEDRSLRDEMGKNAFLYAVENHSIDKMVEQLISVF